jgi:hypothetical protein
MPEAGVSVVHLRCLGDRELDREKAALGILRDLEAEDLPRHPGGNGTTPRQDAVVQRAG